MVEVKWCQRCGFRPATHAARSRCRPCYEYRLEHDGVERPAELIQADYERQGGHLSDGTRERLRKLRSRRRVTPDEALRNLLKAAANA